jgi:peroxiredoxin Q/BCP
MRLTTGTEVPNFTATTDKAGDVTLEELKGKKVVLFFYPKDDTPGCTKESCEFRDMIGEFKDKNAVVFGVSGDDVESHHAFATKFQLNFPLIADTDFSLCKAFGVYGEQEWQGKKFMGISRTTVVIDEAGKLVKVYENVNPVGHAQAVLAEL